MSAAHQARLQALAPSDPLNYNPAVGGASQHALHNLISAQAPLMSSHALPSVSSMMAAAAASVVPMGGVVPAGGFGMSNLNNTNNNGNFGVFGGGFGIVPAQGPGLALSRPPPPPTLTPAPPTFYSFGGAPAPPPLVAAAPAGTLGFVTAPNRITTGVPSAATDPSFEQFAAALLAAAPHRLPTASSGSGSGASLGGVGSDQGGAASSSAFAAVAATVTSVPTAPPSFADVEMSESESRSASAAALSALSPARTSQASSQRLVGSGPTTPESASTTTTAAATTTPSAFTPFTSNVRITRSMTTPPSAPRGQRPSVIVAPPITPPPVPSRNGGEVSGYRGEPGPPVALAAITPPQERELESDPTQRLAHAVQIAQRQVRLQNQEETQRQSLAGGTVSNAELQYHIRRSVMLTGGGDLTRAVQHAVAQAARHMDSFTAASEREFNDLLRRGDATASAHGLTLTEALAQARAEVEGHALAPPLRMSKEQRRALQLLGVQREAELAAWWGAGPSSTTTTMGGATDRGEGGQGGGGVEPAAGVPVRDLQHQYTEVLVQMINRFPHPPGDPHPPALRREPPPAHTRGVGLVEGGSRGFGAGGGVIEAVMQPPLYAPPRLVLLSLEPGPRLGSELRATSLEGGLASGVTSVKMSPSSTHVLLGYGVRDRPPMHLMPETERQHRVITIYRLDDMKLLTSIRSEDDDVNIALFHPIPGAGFVYGTKQGRLRAGDLHRVEPGATDDVTMGEGVAPGEGVPLGPAAGMLRDVRTILMDPEGDNAAAVNDVNVPFRLRRAPVPRYVPDDSSGIPSTRL